MRILFVNEKCGYFGGVEQNVASTARGLRRMGHQCFLAYGVRTDRDAEGYLSIFDNAFSSMDISRGQENEGGRPFDQIVGEVGADVLFVHKIPDSAFLMDLFGRVRMTRMVHDHDLCCPRRHKYLFHNSRVCHYPAGFRCYLDLAFLAPGQGGRRIPSYVSVPEKLREMRRNYRFDGLMVGSRFMREELLQNGFPEQRVHIVPPVVPMEAAEPSPAPEDPVILCVAQLVRGKGVDLLLKALSTIKTPFRAVIAGTGNAEQGLRDLSRRLGLEDRVQFSGWVSPERIGAYYEKAKVVVAPSRWPEPFGMVGLEAMNRGRAVVAFDVGGISDWLEHGVSGLLAPEQDIAALAEALELVTTDSEMARAMGRRAFLNAQERFSFPQYLERIERLLSDGESREVLAEKHPSGCGEGE